MGSRNLLVTDMEHEADSTLKDQPRVMSEHNGRNHDANASNRRAFLARRSSIKSINFRVVLFLVTVVVGSNPAREPIGE
jgi:hypothetical protein